MAPCSMGFFSPSSCPPSVSRGGQGARPGASNEPLLSSGPRRFERAAPLRRVVAPCRIRCAVSYCHAVPNPWCSITDSAQHPSLGERHGLSTAPRCRAGELSKNPPRLAPEGPPINAPTLVPRPPPGVLGGPLDGLAPRRARGPSQFLRNFSKIPPITLLNSLITNPFP